MSINEACKYLAKNSKEKRTEQQWFGYLKHNARKYMEQDGYKIVSHVIGGRLCYTKASLQAFVQTMGDPNKRISVQQVLNDVDKPKAKSKVKSKVKMKAKLKK